MISIRPSLLKPTALVLIHIIVYAISMIFLGVSHVGLVPAGFVLMGLLLWISVVDFQTFRIPNVASLGLILSGCVQVYILNSEHLIYTLALSGIWPALFWFVSYVYAKRRGRMGLGFGDVKLVAGLALWVGFSGMISVVLLSSLAGIATIISLAVIRGDPKAKLATMPIAFGPFLCFFTWIVWLQGVV